MNKANISTIIVIICLLIIGLYAMGEVNYFSSKITIEKNLNSPKIIIPTVGVEETINNVSLNQGVLLDPPNSIPINDSVILFGHRTLQGSPFLRLNEIKLGDTLTLEWPDVGEVNYTVTNTTIVPEEYELVTKGNNLYLITCDPIGSTENRLIVEGEVASTGEIDNEILVNNPLESFALMISLAFLIFGIILSFIYPKEHRVYILVVVIIISAVLFYCSFNPFPSEIIYNYLNRGF